MVSEPCGVVVLFREGVTEEQARRFIASYDLIGHILNPYGEWEGKKMLFFVKVSCGEEEKWVREFSGKYDVVESSTPNNQVIRQAM